MSDKRRVAYIHHCINVCDYDAAASGMLQSARQIDSLQCRLVTVEVGFARRTNTKNSAMFTGGNLDIIWFDGFNTIGIDARNRSDGD